MSLTPDHRQAYRRWLIERDLQPEVADAILETMPPFDWSNIARSDTVDQRFDAVDQRFDAVDQRFKGVDQRFDAVDQRFDAVERRLDEGERRLGAIDGRLDRLDGRMELVEGRLGRVEDGLVVVGTRLDGLHQSFMSGAISMVATLIIGFATIAAAILLTA